ncbi:uncharacterized protein B0H64DRAFT_374262 [Chaetomium fimeti]|uniref:Zn(2)-C6 fungal-type domain-containing protein n=1 Tax=Chaetomium fimeti TaxID=1854472 RepID=A0AAE0LSF2_9PEZI|nr:hypothetical protein B0H64DRAFT_374262 [Chaetomium fimeti]
MVGVPGKYKGCETCRLRRVKCDNQRPYCRKCLDGGRTCAGYERETVFIIGTVEDQGRCSSHPPRVVKPKRSGASSRKASPAPRGQLWEWGWDRDQDRDRRGRGDADGGVFVSLPGYRALDVQPGMADEEFRLASQCLVHLGAPEEGLVGGGRTATDGTCLFLYEHNTSSYFSNQPPWKDPSAQTNAVRRLGPEHFRAFPAHHFFVRIYRPTAIMTALINRTPIFLAEPQWLSTPFEAHPKSALDRLFDSLALLPSLLARADRVLAQEHTLTRRLMAQDLLNNCLDLEVELSRWYTALQVSPASGISQPLFWLSNPPLTASSTAPHPYHLPDPLSFRDAHTALALSYYWTALVLFYPTIWRLYFAAVIDPVTAYDTSTTTTSTTTSIPTTTSGNPPATTFPPPHHHPHHHPQHQHDLLEPTTLPLPTRLQTLDPMRYSLPRVRDAAADVCRALEFFLAGAGPSSNPPPSSCNIKPSLSAIFVLGT